jgi:hypothetical protein
MQILLVLLTLSALAFNSLSHLTLDQDKQQAETPRTSRVVGSRLRAYRAGHALVIGVNKYQCSDVNPLNLAEKDAQDVGKLLEEKYGYQVQRLMGASATKEAILEALTKYQRELGEDDVLVVYFAGHGETVGPPTNRRGFLRPYNGCVNRVEDPDEWAKKTLDMREEIPKLISQMKARHVLMAIDACFSGFVGKRSGESAVSPDLMILLNGKSRLVITAGTDKQTALENPTHYQNGHFTHVLLQQLSADSPVGVREMFVSLRRGVIKLTDGRMQPQLREIVVEDGEFVLLPLKPGTNIASTKMIEAGRRIVAENGADTKLADLFEVIDTEPYRYSAYALEKEAVWKAKVARFEENAALGNALAMAALYYCYRDGLGVEPNHEQAYKWAVEAHDTGHPSGMHVLSRAYSRGDGVKANPIVADRLLQEALRNGFAVSFYKQLKL